MFRIAHVALVAAFLLLSARPAPPADPAGEEPFAGTRTGGPWLGTEDRVLARRDEARPAASVTLAVGADLTALHVEPTVGRAFAADATNARLVVVDVAVASIIGEIPMRAGPSAIAATWDGAWLFVGHTGNRSILVVNPDVRQASSTPLVYGATSMVKLPTPPWAHRRETCPNCLDRIADKKSLVCIRCGYQLRMPFVALVGLVGIAGGIGGLLMSAFGGDVIPWPAMPFGLKVPFLENPTPADLRTLSAWLGGLALLLGSVLAFAGAYMIRRRSDRVVRGSRPA